MKYQVRPSRFDREWIVEAFNEDGDGDIHIAAFSGPEAKTRAFEYAAWKNNQDREPITA
jgi:hypothetical protein